MPRKESEGISLAAQFIPRSWLTCHQCDATGTTSCSECASRNVRCQFTKETNRRMSSIKSVIPHPLTPIVFGRMRRQIQDSERQLDQARQQLERLKSFAPNSDMPFDRDSGHLTHVSPELLKAGLPPSRRTKHPADQELSRARANLRNYGHGLLKVPAPYRPTCSQHGQPPQIPRLPPRHVGDRSLGQYYDCIHRGFPILHWPTFHEDYQEVYIQDTVAGAPRVWAAVLFLVFACGSLHTMDRDRVQEGKSYLSKGTAMIDFWQDDLSVDQARMALLTSIFLTEVNLKSASWVWLGSAIRIAQDIGLHVESGPWPTIEGEVRKRTWYCIYAWDRYVEAVTC